MARALLDSDTLQSIGTLKFLTTAGHKGIFAETRLADLDEAFTAATTASTPALYVAVTGQMARWMGSISTIGNWDIEKAAHFTPQQPGRSAGVLSRLELSVHRVSTVTELSGRRN